MEVTATQFLGSWEDRLENLFNSGIAWRGKRVLDAGCNMGIVGYEVTKLTKASYHGVDILTKHLDVARSIFKGVTTPSLIDKLDLGDKEARLTTLGSYDVVLYLAVHHHIVKNQGDPVADSVARELFKRAGSFLVYRGPELDYMKLVADFMDFDVLVEHPPTKLHPLCSFIRR